MGRQQPVPQQQLFIFPVEHNDPHDKVLHAAQQPRDLRDLASMSCIHALPGMAMVADAAEREFEFWKQTLLVVGHLGRRGSRAISQDAILNLHHGEEALAQRLMVLQVRQ